MTILFEDEALVAVDKSEGTSTIPERRTTGGSVLEELTAAVAYKPFTVHRLDKEVSGVLLFAKNAAAHRHLCTQFEKHTITKHYTALAIGAIGQIRGVIEQPIRQYGSGRMGVDGTGGKPCLTEYAVVTPLDGFTLVDVTPKTGRRHQIRVHFYHIGHPLAGDSRYGDLAYQKRFPRLMLHASRVTFRHPDGTEKTIESPLPASFRAVIENLATYAQDLSAKPLAAE